MHRKLVYITFILLVLVSCKKEESTNSTAKKTSPILEQGVLNAFIINSYWDIYSSQPKPLSKPVRQEMALAQFPDSVLSKYYPNDSFPGQLYVGDVFCNNSFLDFDSVTGYSYGNITKPYIFKDTVKWKVNGSGVIKGFSEYTTIGFPYVSQIKADTIYRNKDFLMEIDSVINADSIMFNIGGLVYGGNMESGQTKKHTFKTSEWSHAANWDQGYYRATIYAVRFEVRNINGRNYVIDNFFWSQKYLWFK